MAKYIVQMRRGTSTQWEDSGIIPLAGEIVVEIDDINNLHKLKIGDGKHAYSELAYLMAGDEIVTQVLSKALPRIVTVELTPDWTLASDNTYSQAINLDGITKYSRLDLQPNVDMMAEFKQLGIVLVTENKDCQITIYSVGNVPLKTYTMQATIVETDCCIEDPIVGIPVGTSGTGVDNLPVDPEPTEGSTNLVASGGVWTEVKKVNTRCDSMNQMFFDLHYIADVISEEKEEVFTDSARTTYYPSSYGSLPEGISKSAGILEIAGKTIIDSSGNRIDAKFKSIQSYGADGRLLDNGKIEASEEVNMPNWTYLKFDEQSTTATWERYLTEFNLISANYGNSFTYNSGGSGRGFKKWIGALKSLDMDVAFSELFCIGYGSVNRAYVYDSTRTKDRSFSLMWEPGDTPGYRIFFIDSECTSDEKMKSIIAGFDNRFYLYGKTSSATPLETKTIVMSQNLYPIEKDGQEKIFPEYNEGAPALKVKTAYYALARLNDIENRISAIEARLSAIEAALESLST